MKKASSIDTVAADCGLSRTTVSAVLRGEAERYRISPATAARVRASAETLGWKPNLFARALNRKTSGTIGVLFPDIFEHFMGETVRGIEDCLAEYDCRMMLSTSRFNPQEELLAIEAFTRRGVDGLIFAPYATFATDPRGARTAALVEAIGTLPCVIIDRTIDGLIPSEHGWDFVVQADRVGAMQATVRLAGTEARRVGLISFDLGASSLRERRAGYAEAAQELGFDGFEILLNARDSSSPDLRDALNAADRLTDRPSAWFATTEGLGLKAAALLEDRGYRIGSDVLVGRFAADSGGFRTGLLGVRQPHRELGRQAGRVLMDRIEANEGSTRLSPRSITLSVSVIDSGRRGSFAT